MSQVYTEAEQEVLNLRARHPQSRQVVIFAPSLPWDDKMFQRPQQLARALAKRGALVFYMQPDRSWPPVFTEIEERLVLCQTPADAFRVIPEAFIYVLTWNIPLLAYFERPRVIYDYLDDLSVFQGDAQRLQRDHGDYLLKAELVVTSAERLHQQALRLRKEALLCPNGVDTPHFAAPPVDSPIDMAPILAQNKPIIGYHGAMARWFDYELLKKLAEQRPEYSFVLIGSDHDGTLGGSGLLESANVDWLGSKPYVELPRYVQHFKIGLIPFVVNDITHAVSPIKLFEYFAAGKPVVTSPMEESLRVGNVLAASTPEEWLAKIDQALALADDPAYIANLQAVSRENSWETRAESILTQLDALPAFARKQTWVSRLLAKSAGAQRLLRIIGKVLKVWRMSGFTGVFKGVYYKLYDKLSALRRSKLFRLPRELDDTYILEDNSQVTMYSDDPALLPDYWPRTSLQDNRNPRPRVSLISTTYNEEKRLAAWLETVFAQSSPPDEIVIVDGGSRDNTLAVLHEMARKSPVPMRVIQQKGANISRGRNLAIEQSQYPVIAVTDGGCLLHKTWLENLIAPFSSDPQTEVVAGWYRAVDSGGQELPYKGWPTLQDIDPQTFVPSSRSLAFTKASWEAAGKYPEWLTLTGEDTYFALELKRFCSRWAFVPSAVVDWIGPENWSELSKKARYWSVGNGELGYNAWLYRLTAKRLAVLAFVWLVGFIAGGVLLTGLLGPLWAWAASLILVSLAGIVLFSIAKKMSPAAAMAELLLRIAQVRGFWTGARNKPKVDLRRLAETRGLYFILAGVPIDDTGGGARSTQLALELLRQNYWVVYLHRYPRWESQAAVIKIAHPNLFTYGLGEFKWDDFSHRYQEPLKGRDIVALVEFPSPEFLPFMRTLQQAGGKILYDMIDDWNSSLGNWGFSPSIEREMIRLGDGLMATAPILQEKLEEASQRTVLLHPNAVNSRLFNPGRRYPRPDDLPDAAWSAIYIGALWGDWFDWDLLEAVARAYPQASLVVVGDYRGQCPNPPANLTFLGLKPQSALPAYLAHTDIAIIPWKVNEITQATSPLKLYEYLAMRKPVVTPDLLPLHGIPGVFRAADKQDFVRLVNDVRLQELPMQEIDAFVSENNWQARIRQLIEWLKQEYQQG